MPLFEPTDTPGITRLVPFRGVGLGRAPLPSRNDGFNVPLHQPSAEAIAVISSIRDQAGQGRVGRRHAQAQGTTPSIRQDGELGVEAAPAGPSAGSASFFGARPPRSRARSRSCCPAARRTHPAWPAGGPAGAARRLGCTKLHSGHRPISAFRTRAATRA